MILLPERTVLGINVEENSCNWLDDSVTANAHHVSKPISSHDDVAGEYSVPVVGLWFSRSFVKYCDGRSVQVLGPELTIN